MSTKASYSIDEVFSETASVRIYGSPLATPIKLSATQDRTVGPSGSVLQFVLVRGLSVGLTYCKRLPAPIFLALPGKGEPPEASDNCAKSGELVWSVPLNATTSMLAPGTGTVEDLLNTALKRGIDGGLNLSNPRFENGKICVDIHIWGKIEIFGAKADFDQTFPVCIPAEGCTAVWDIGWAHVDLCFRAPKQLCAKLCVGRWGLEQCWDACIDLPINRSTEAPAPCGCHK